MSVAVTKHAGSPFGVLRGVMTSISEMLDTFRAAVAVSSAVENRRKPAARDLRALGIAPESFSVRL